MRHMTTGSPARVFSAAAEVLTTPHGTGISLRPLSGDDRAAFAALFARLTPESRYRRFLSPKRELTTRELAFFTDTDHLNHEAAPRSISATTRSWAFPVTCATQIDRTPPSSRSRSPMRSK